MSNNAQISIPDSMGAIITYEPGCWDRHSPAQGNKNGIPVTGYQYTSGFAVKTGSSSIGTGFRW